MRYTPAQLVAVGSRNEARKQRMRLQWLRFEFRVELAAQEPRMVRQLGNLHEVSVRRIAGEFHAVAADDFFIFPVELIAMAVSFGYFLVSRKSEMPASPAPARRDTRRAACCRP